MTPEEALNLAHLERMRPRFRLPVDDDQPMSDLYPEANIRGWEDGIEQMRQAMLTLASEVHRLRGDPITTWTLEDFWQEPTMYLSFLRPFPGKVMPKWGVKALRESLRGKSKEERVALIKAYLGFDDTVMYWGWRTDLVACVITLMGLGDGDPQPFWDRLLAWTWAAPQVAATLSIIDPEFEAKAAELLDNPANFQREDRFVNGKAFHSLLALMVDHPRYDAWLETYGDGDEVWLGFVADLVPKWRDSIMLTLA